MAPKIIVSYDDTDNDRDALALGRLLAVGGASLSLAYVRHAHTQDPGREASEQKRAEALLAHGAEAIGAPDAPRHVIVHASTGEGLLELAEELGADVVVFGSEYRTAPGAVSPGTSAQRMMNGGSTAIAIAPADLRSHPSVRVSTIGVIGEGDEAPDETARSLAKALDATVADPEEADVDLLVVGSREGAPHGRLELSASADYEIETASVPVIAVPSGVAIEFGAAAVAV